MASCLSLSDHLPSKRTHWGSDGECKPDEKSKFIFKSLWTRYQVWPPKLWMQKYMLCLICLMWASEFFQSGIEVVSQVMPSEDFPTFAMSRCWSVGALEASRMQYDEIVKCTRNRIMLRCSSVEAQEVSRMEYGDIISLRLRGSVEILGNLGASYN